MLNRLTPPMRRRFLTNMALLVAVVAVFFAAPRLGPLAIPLLLGAFALYVPAFTLYKMLRAEPKPGARTWIFWSVMSAALAVTIGDAVVTHRLSPANLLLATVLTWGFIISQRGIVLSSAYARDGSKNERFRDVRRRLRGGGRGGGGGAMSKVDLETVAVRRRKNDRDRPNRPAAQA